MNTWHVAPDPNRRHYPSSWLVALAGPVAWAADLEIIYALTPHACGSNRIWLHLALVVGLIVAGFGETVALLNHSSYGRPGGPGDDESPTAQVRFLSTIGLMSNALSGLGLMAQWVAIFLLDPCSPT